MIRKEFEVRLIGRPETGPTILRPKEITNENTNESIIEMTYLEMALLLNELRFLQESYQYERRRTESLRGIGNRITRGIGEGILDERERMIARHPGFDSIFRGTYNAPTIHWTPDTWVEEW